jgi:hypothetical protein
LGYSGLEIFENEVLNSGFCEMILFIKKGKTFVYMEREGF